ncbi:MAG: DUF3489 domain-containing protein [Pseudomonadota bacterium]|nr:DUF3489 domain-containing protein [Pseudomonadota bacterium]
MKTKMQSNCIRGLKTPAGHPKLTKQAYLIYLLRQPDGQTIQDMVETLDWQPNTVRAAITRLRQSGHSIERYISKDNRICYRLVGNSAV